MTNQIYAKSDGNYLGACSYIHSFHFGRFFGIILKKMKKNYSKITRKQKLQHSWAFPKMFWCFSSFPNTCNSLMLRLSIFICVEIEGLQHVNAMSWPLGWDVWVNEWKWCAFEACMRARENAKKIIDLRQHTEYMYPSGRLYSTHSSVRAGEKNLRMEKASIHIFIAICYLPMKCHSCVHCKEAKQHKI